MRTALSHAPALSAVLFLSGVAVFVVASQAGAREPGALHLLAAVLCLSSLAVLQAASIAAARIGARFTRAIVRYGYLLLATLSWFALIGIASLQPKGPPGLHLTGPSGLDLVVLICALPGILATIAAIGASLWMLYVGVAMRDAVLE